MLKQQTSNQHSLRNNLTSNTHLQSIVKIIDSFEADMDKTLADMLLTKQNSVSNVYNRHIFKIKEEIDMLKHQIQQQHKKIDFYQSEGTIANFLRRIKILEDQQNELFQTIDKKNAEIRQLRLENIINKSQNKRMQQKIKELIRKKNLKSFQLQSSPSSPEAFQSMQTFSTQTSPTVKGYTQQVKISQNNQLSLKTRLKKQKSFRSQETINTQPAGNKDLVKLQKQLLNLKKQNRQLLTINNKIIFQCQNIEQFFKNSVAQIKSNIMFRKKIKECSYQDFKKEDKIELLIKIISNQQILFYLYQKLFGKNKLSQYNKMVIKSEKSSKQKLRVYPKARFPTISSGNSYLN